MLTAPVDGRKLTDFRPWLTLPPGPRGLPSTSMRRWLPLALLLAACSNGDGSAPAPIVCAPGQQVECTCPGGDRSAQVCNPSRTGYDVCACGATGAAGSDGETGAAGAATPFCQPNTGRLCVGSNGCNGFQSCDSSGATWLDCQCLK